MRSVVFPKRNGANGRDDFMGFEVLLLDIKRKAYDKGGRASQRDRS